jgi:ribosomal protein S18 acetylase RimI-like enzyme
MTFVVEELMDPSPARPALDELARLNSEHVDLTAEANLPHARFWVVHTGNVALPVAYALVWILGNEIEIIDIATAVEWRRRGAARALMSALLQRYGERGVDAVFLEVRATNHAAMSLYAHVGFEQTRVRPRYYSNGDDAWDMRLQLSRGT